MGGVRRAQDRGGAGRQERTAVAARSRKAAPESWSQLRRALRAPINAPAG